MDNAPRPSGTPSRSPLAGRPLGLPALVLLALGAVALATYLTGGQLGTAPIIRFDEFRRQAQEGNVEVIRITGDVVEGKFRTPPPAEPGQKSGGGHEGFN